MTGWPWPRHPRSSLQWRVEAVTRNLVTADIAAFHEDLASLEDLDIAGLDAVLQDASVSTPGLAPEDLNSMRTQRLRWAQGTIQVMFRENRFAQKGLIFGILPVTSISTEFFIRLIPFLLVNQLLFAVVGKGVKMWRRQQDDTFRWDLVKPQLWAMGLLVTAALIGVIRMIAGQADILGPSVNILCVVFDLVIFSVIFQAVRYRGYEHYQADIAQAKAQRETKE